MREFIAFFFTGLLFITQIVYLPVSAWSFEYHKDYIAGNLCVNRNNVNSTCKGCCYLKKEVEQNSSTSKSNHQKEESSSLQLQFEQNPEPQLHFASWTNCLYYKNEWITLQHYNDRLIKPPGK